MEKLVFTPARARLIRVPLPRTLTLPLATKLAIAGIFIFPAGILRSAGHFPGGYRPICNSLS